MSAAETLILSKTEENWARAMEEACHRHLQKLEGRPMNNGFLMVMAKKLFNRRELKLPQTPPKFRFYNPPQQGNHPIQGFFWGRTTEDHPASLSFYKEGVYRPHAHAAAWILVISGGGSAFHYDEKCPGHSGWLDLVSGKLFYHGDNVFHGYKLKDSLLLAIGACSASGSLRPEIPEVARAFNKSLLPANG